MEILYTLLCSRQATFINMVIGALLFLALVFLLFRRSSRDERGWKIIGKASIAALLCFAVCATLFSHAMQYVTIQRSPAGMPLVLDAYFAVNAVQLTFNATAAVEIAGILILRRKE